MAAQKMKKQSRKPKKKGVETKAPRPEEIPELKPNLKVVEDQEDLKEVRRAVPTSDVLSHETTMALKTCSKYIAGWRYLKKGVLFTAPKEVIEVLRGAGYVE